MKVKELIEKLRKEDPMDEVYFWAVFSRLKNRSELSQNNLTDQAFRELARNLNEKDIPINQETKQYNSKKPDSKKLRIKLTIEQENEIAQSMKKYSENQFKLYCDETGWEDWMDNFAYEKKPTVSESHEIRRIQRDIWDEVFEA